MNDNKVDEAVNALRTLLSQQREATQQRLRAAEAALKEAQSELEASQAAADQVEAQYNAYNSSFPAAAAARTRGKAPGGAPPATRSVTKPSRGGGKVLINRIAKSGTPKTLPDRLAHIMGKSVWQAGELEEALLKSGHPVQSNNLRSYISTVLNSTLVPVRNPDGVLTDANGRPVKVHLFKPVERGHYRVSVDEDIQAEVKQILGASEVVVIGGGNGGNGSGSGSSGFSEQHEPMAAAGY